VRRIIIGLTAAALLVMATAALAAANHYTASISFSPGKAGSAKHPVPTGMVQNLAATPLLPNKRAAPLTDITTSTYGLKSTVTSKTPKCTGAQITVAHDDNTCPKGALVATGRVHSLLGPSNLLDNNPKDITICNPYLDVWNGGPGKLVFFFVTHSALDCGGLKTGSTAPYFGKVTEVGKTMVVDVSLPADISTSVANIPNYYGSLIQETLTYKKGFQSSIACKSGKRPYSVKYTAKGVPTVTVKGTASCH
jgi:hypothetical protein